MSHILAEIYELKQMIVKYEGYIVELEDAYDFIEGKYTE